MKSATAQKQEKRMRRHRRVRAKVSGTATRPRLNVYRGLTTVYVQLIDDISGKTIASVHTKKIAKADAGERTGKVALAYTAGKQIAELAKAAGITECVFDRGGFRYHGRVKAVAEGAREGGLTF